MTFEQITRAFLILLAIGLIGCASTARKAMEDIDKEAATRGVKVTASISDPSKTGPPLDLSNQNLEQYRETVSSHGTLKVEGPKAYRELVERLALAGAKTLQATEEELAIRSDQTLNLVMIPVTSDQWPSDFTADLRSDSKLLTVPVLFEASAHTLPELLSGENFLSIGVIGHEYFEVSLCMNGSNLRLAMDPEKEWAGITIRARAFTRWYRDGFATYAAMVWLDKLHEQAGTPTEDRPPVVHQENAVKSLEGMGAKIFNWTQFSKKESTPYYEASLGLFLKLEEEFGREKIRAWNEAIEESTTRYKTRADLLRSAREVYGIPLRQFARESRPAT